MDHDEVEHEDVNPPGQQQISKVTVNCSADTIKPYFLTSLTPNSIKDFKQFIYLKKRNHQKVKRHLCMSEQIDSIIRIQFQTFAVGNPSKLSDKAAKAYRKMKNKRFFEILGLIFGEHHSTMINLLSRLYRK
jgi:hypothetical protein